MSPSTTAAATKSNGGPRLIEGVEETFLLSQARQLVAEKTRVSVLLDVHAEERIPKFRLDELELGKILGRGGFCAVSEIAKITLKEGGGDDEQANGGSGNHNQQSQQPNPVAHDEYFIHNVVQDRGFMEKHCIRTGKDCRYAVKQLQEATFKDKHAFLNGIIDLAIEARFLAVIRHPNIIKMRAMAAGDYFRSEFFVVLDRLYDILTGRLQQWRKSNPSLPINRMLSFGRKKKTDFWVMRIQVAYDLSCALKYLHDNHIVYRDLKPDNIGFDVRGDVKIFDFGLAKEIDSTRVRSDGLYKLTGDTGSPRYMAPEVALEQPYNEKADVYSFTVLVWQMVALETPYENFSYKMLHSNVFKGSLRPKIQPKWPPGIQRLFNEGWTKNIQERLTMEELQGLLRDEINSNQDEEVSEVLDASRKSEMSARGSR